MKFPRFSAFSEKASAFSELLKFITSAVYCQPVFQTFFGNYSCQFLPDCPSLSHVFTGREVLYHSIKDDSFCQPIFVTFFIFFYRCPRSLWFPAADRQLYYPNKSSFTCQPCFYTFYGFLGILRVFILFRILGELVFVHIICTQKHRMHNSSNGSVHIIIMDGSHALSALLYTKGQSALNIIPERSYHRLIREREPT